MEINAWSSEKTFIIRSKQIPLRNSKLKTARNNISNVLFNQHDYDDEEED